MENKNNSNEDKVLFSGFDNVVELKIPEWNQNMVKAIENSPLYKSSLNTTNISKASKMVKLETSISTNGWDTVSICRVSALNALIKAEKTYPDQIDTSEPGYNFSVKGSFDAWQVVTGGDGKNVKIRVPFKDGFYKGLSYYGKDVFDITGSYADILLKLQYFPLPETTLTDGEYNLYVNTEGATSTEPIAAVINFEVTNCDMDDVNKSILKGQIEKWLNIPENLKKFDTLFSTVIINNMGQGSEEFKWLNPTTIGYAYTDANTEDSSIFGILCMTNDRSSAGLPNQLPAITLKEDDNSIFVISRELFVKYKLLPSLPEIFKNSPDAKYTLSKDGLTINATNLKLDPISYKGSTYYPVADSFEISFDSEFIRTTSNISCSLPFGIVSHSLIVAKQTLVMAKNNKGEKVMAYQTVGKPDINNSVTIPPGVIITELISAILGGVFIGVAAWFGGAVLALIVGIIVLLVVAIMVISIHVIIAKIIAEGVLESVPSIEPMVKLSSKKIKWPFCSEGGIDLTNIDYSGALVFEGNLAIKESFCIKAGKLISA
ncbi:MAG: TULIP family P47-like protein [Lachnospiraceae bacterium]|nr:TULIP family P47-like protein [Lachnospiraceae bacterium]